jgi:hypothetical protein
MNHLAQAGNKTNLNEWFEYFFFLSLTYRALHKELYKIDDLIIQIDCSFKSKWATRFH